MMIIKGKKDKENAVKGWGKSDMTSRRGIVGQK
jgi:hypothetical protein